MCVWQNVRLFLALSVCCNIILKEIFLCLFLNQEKKDKKREVTGYSLYASDARKLVAANNPGSSFGDVSRIVGGQVNTFNLFF